MMSSYTPTHVALSPSVELFTIQDTTHKTARLSIYTLWDASPQISPLATLLFGVLRRGSQAYPKLSLLNRRLDELYGTTLTMRNFLVGDTHVLSFTAEMLEDAYLPAGESLDILAGTMEVLSELLCRPQVQEDGCLRTPVVEQEKISLCDSIKADINDPRSYAMTRHRQIMCQDQPYGVSLTGDVDGVMTMTTEDVTKVFQKLTGGVCWQVYYTGQASHERVKICFENAFAKHWPTHHTLTPTYPHTPPAQPRSVEESLPLEQGRLCMSWTKDVSDREEHPATVVFCELLGVMQSAILFRTVREEMGLCYDCDTYYEATKGILTVTAGIHPNNRQAAEQAISQAIVDIQNGNLDPHDVRLAQLSLQNAYAQIPESAAATEAYWFRHQREGLEIPPPDMLEKLMNVTPQEVVAVARRFVADTVYFLNATAGEEV